MFSGVQKLIFVFYIQAIYKRINRAIVMFVLTLYIDILKRLAEDWYLTLLELVTNVSLQIYAMPFLRDNSCFLKC